MVDLWRACESVHWQTGVQWTNPVAYRARIFSPNSQWIMGKWTDETNNDRFGEFYCVSIGLEACFSDGFLHQLSDSQ